jgi:hypothetical protein
MKYYNKKSLQVLQNDYKRTGYNSSALRMAFSFIIDQLSTHPHHPQRLSNTTRAEKAMDSKDYLLILS